MNSADVTDLHGRPRELETGGPSGGDGIDGRLRAVEDRLARIETELRHLATKEDIEAKFASQLKWMLGTVITVVIGLAVIALRLVGD